MMFMNTSTRDTYIDFLKALAIFFMILDHIACYLMPADLSSTIFIRGFGRIAMPLFFITHGYLLAHRCATLSSDWLSVRIRHFIVIGVFITGILYLLNQPLVLNILFQFAYIELIWLFLLYRGSLFCIASVFVIACYLVGVDLLINWFYSGDYHYVFRVIDYGYYPLFYSAAGSVLGYSPQSKFFQTIAILLLVITLSFQYNIFIEAILFAILDWSYISFTLASLLIPVLFWYIPQSTTNFPITSLAITFVSRHAFTIYFFHLQLIFILLLVSSHA